MKKSLNMTKTITFGYKEVLLLRRLIGCVAMGGMIMVLAFLLGGVIPFRGLSMPVVPAVNNIFEFIYLGHKPFWYCVSCIAFAVLYICVGVKIIISLVAGFGSMKQWFMSPHDNRESRLALKKTVSSFNTVVGLFFTLYAASFLISRFPVSSSAVVTFWVLAVLDMVVNCMVGLTFTGEILDSVVGAINQGVCLACIVVFIVMSPGVQALDIFSAMSPLIEILGVAEKYVVQTVCKQVLIPIFYFIFWGSILRFYFDMDYRINDQKTVAKKILIRNIILVVIIMFGIGYSNTYFEMADYLDIVSKHSVFLIVTGILLVVALNPGFVARERLFLGGPGKNKSAAKQKVDSAEKNETLQNKGKSPESVDSGKEETSETVNSAADADTSEPEEKTVSEDSADE